MFLSLIPFFRTYHLPSLLHSHSTLFFFLMIRRPPRSTLDRSSAASDVYKRQLLNVLRGEMSIVGPRPERPEFVQTLNEQIPYYRPVSYTHLRAHETVLDLVCRLLLEKKNNIQ